MTAQNLPADGSVAIETTTNLFDNSWDLVSETPTMATVLNLTFPLLRDHDQRYYRATLHDPP